MTTDHRQLCLKLFDTDSVDELKEIADIVKNRTPRNASCKQWFPVLK